MGLDIYIRRYEDRADSRRREAEYEQRVNYDTMSKEEREAIAKELGLSGWGTDETGCADLAAPSPKHPDHLCNLGYFRSSYNEGGFNRVVPNLLGDNADFYWLFDYDEEGYEFQPDWAAVKERAEDLLRRYDEATADGFLRSFCAAPNSYETSAEIAERCSDSAAAIALYKKTMAGQTVAPGFSSFSNKDGDFFTEGLTILALIPGKAVLGGLGIHVVYRDDANAAHYRATIEILIEACEAILARNDIDKIWVAWSG